MNRVVIDQQMRDRLGNLRHPLELCDESGRVLAYLTPAVTQEAYKRVQSPHSEEELQRREQEEETYSTREVLERLEQH
jgi:hypothetical protein